MSSESDAVERAHQALRATLQPIGEARKTLQQAVAAVESVEKRMHRAGGHVVAQQLHDIGDKLRQAGFQVQNWPTCCSRVLTGRRRPMTARPPSRC